MNNGATAAAAVANELCWCSVITCYTEKSK